KRLARQCQSSLRRCRPHGLLRPPLRPHPHLALPIPPPLHPQPPNHRRHPRHHHRPAHRRGFTHARRRRQPLVRLHPHDPPLPLPLDLRPQSLGQHLQHPSSRHCPRL